MKACEALEAMKEGIRVVAFEPNSNIADEMFQLSDPETIEIFVPSLSDQPALVMTPKEFLQSYSEADLVEYNAI